MDTRRTVLAALAGLPFTSGLLKAQTPKWTSRKTVLPRLGITTRFLDRGAMRVGHPTRRFKLGGQFPSVTLPIDWTKGDTLSFPLDGNGYQQFGD